MNIRTILKTHEDDGWTVRAQTLEHQRKWGDRKSTVGQNHFNTWNKKQRKSKVNDERACHQCPFFLFFFLTSIHTLKKRQGGRVRVKREGGWGYRWQCAGKHLHGVETMSKFQVARGQFSKKGAGSCPVPREDDNVLFLWWPVRRWQIAEPLPAHLPQMCPWQPEHCKSCYPFKQCRSLQAPDSTPPQGSLVARSTLFWRENGGHANWRRIMGGWNEDDSV